MSDKQVSLGSRMQVDLIDHMGSDRSIVNAARVSTMGSDVADIEDDAISKGDEALIGFLMREQHASPFEHCVMTFRVYSPLFVGRQLLRHRTNSFNEESARYREMELDFYIPPYDRPLLQVGKPGAYTFEQGELDLHTAMFAELVSAYRAGSIAYKNMIDMGIAREIARAALPSGIFSSMYVTMKLRNAFQFLALRTRSEDAKVPSHPQWEIEQVADQIELRVAELYPVSYEAWTRNGRVGF